MKTTPATLRSRLAREILRILCFEVVGPVIIAELFELLRVTVHASQSLSRFIHAISGPKNFLYVYLYRLSDRGLVKIEGPRGLKQALLTPKGRRFLRKLQDEEERARYRPPVLQEEQLRRQIEPLPDELIAQKALSDKRSKWHTESSKGDGAAFLSYDIPERWTCRRNWIRDRLRSLGFERFHHSFYLGTTKLLRRLVEEAETWGLVPYLCWGRLKVLPG